MRFVRLCSAIGVLGVLVVAASCSSSSGNPLAGLDEGCTINSDCNAPLVCAFERCHDACTSSRDCPAAERCVASDRPYDVCQLPDEKTCSANSQCPATQLCGVDGQCRDQCAVDRDCIAGQVCRSSTCADPSELTNDMLPVAKDAGAPGTGAPCRYNSDCAVFGLSCVGGECGPECRTNVDCMGGAVCSSGVCVPPDAGTTKDASMDAPAQKDANEDTGPGMDAAMDAPSVMDAADASVTHVPDGAPPGYGAPCVLSSDCATTNVAPLVCIAGVCVFECNQSIDCPLTGCCADNRCVDVASCLEDGGMDAGTDSGDGGAPCVSDDMCDDKMFCDGQERCLFGHCGPAIETPCDSHAACIQDLCDEATHACTHKTIAATDGDGDGHLAIVCGGDDCDDTDKTVFPGAPELCDDKDNDCNGLIDDHSRVPYGSVATSQMDPTFTGGAAAVAGTGFGVLITSPANMGIGFSTQVLPGQPKVTLQTTFAMGANGAVPFIVGIAGEASSFLGLVSVEENCCPVGTAAEFFSSSGTLTNTVGLADFGAASIGGAVQWTGASYLVGWLTVGPGAGLATFGPTGSSVGGVAVPTISGTGKGLAGPGALRIAFSDTAIASLYFTDGAHAEITTYTKGLTKLAGPIALPTDGHVLTAAAIAGRKGGFAIVWDDDTNAFVGQIDDEANFLGSPETIPEGLVFAEGTFDGEGAGFLLGYASGPKFGFSNGKNPFELTGLPITSSSITVADVGHMSASGPVMVASYYGNQGHEVKAMKLGCPPQ